MWCCAMMLDALCRNFRVLFRVFYTGAVAVGQRRQEPPESARHAPMSRAAMPCTPPMPPVHRRRKRAHGEPKRESGGPGGPGGRHDHWATWTPQEDCLIIEMIAKVGPRWRSIAQHLPGRSVASIRNRWLRIEHGQRVQLHAPSSKVRCVHCGEPRRGHVCFELLRRGEEAAERTSQSSSSGASPPPLYSAKALSDLTVNDLLAPGPTHEAAPSLAPSLTSDSSEPQAQHPPALISLRDDVQTLVELGFGALALAMRAQLADVASPSSLPGADDLGPSQLHCGSCETPMMAELMPSSMGLHQWLSTL